MRRAALALAALLFLTACEEWHLSINRDGLVLISVIGDGRDHRERFRVRTRDAGGTTRMVDVPATGQLTLSPVADGELHVALLLPHDCRVSGPNPQTLTVLAGHQDRISFNVHCS